MRRRRERRWQLTGRIDAARIPDLENRRIAHVLIAADDVISAARIVVLGVAPVGWRNRVGPETDCGRIAIEAIARDDVVLAVLDRDAGPVQSKVVVTDLGVLAVAAPPAVLIPPRPIRDDPVAAERRLDAVQPQPDHRESGV